MQLGVFSIIHHGKNTQISADLCLSLSHLLAGLCVSFSQALFISMHEARKLLGVPAPQPPFAARCFLVFRDAAVREKRGFFLIKGVPRVIGIVTERALLS